MWLTMPAENCTGSTTQRLFECDWHRGVSRMVGSVLKRLKGPSSSCALKAKGPFAKIQCSWKLEGGGVFIHPQVVISSSVGFVWKSWNKIQNISFSAVSWINHTLPWLLIIRLTQLCIFHPSTTNNCHLCIMNSILRERRVVYTKKIW